MSDAHGGICRPVVHLGAASHDRVHTGFDEAEKGRPERDGVTVRPEGRS